MRSSNSLSARFRACWNAALFVLCLLLTSPGWALNAPVLATMSAATSNNPETVTGTAPADSEVRLFVNGELMQLTTATGAGTFSTKIALYDGVNSVHATAWDGTVESASSNIEQTTYTNSISRSQSGTISVDTVWTPSGGHYQIADNLTVAAGVELRLMPGVEVRAASLKYITVNGTLVALGTALNPIVFKSAQSQPAAGQWGGIRFYGNAYADFDHVVVEHARDGALYFDGGEGLLRHTILRSSYKGVWIRANSSPTFTDGYEIYGNTEGVLVSGNGIEAQNPLPVFTNGIIRDNTTQNYKTESFGNGGAVVLNATGNWWGTSDAAAIAAKITDNSDQSFYPTVDFGSYLNAAGGTPVHTGGFLMGAVNTNRTIPAGDYQMLGTMRIAVGATLTVEPGTTIRITAAYPLEVNGTLVAHGTEAAPIIFRSGRAMPAAGQWQGIRVYGNGSVDLDYVVVEHATDALYFEGGEGLVRHTTMRTSYKGAWVRANSSPTFTQGYAIHGNSEGVVVSGNSVEAENPQPVFTNGSIHGNSAQNYKTEGFGNGGAAVLNATDNWWGTPDPIAIAAKITDNSDHPTYPRVDYGGYLAAAGGAPVHTGGFLGGNVSADRTISAGDYQVLGALRVAAGVTLTLEPGTTIRITGAYPFEVNGTLLAHGTEAAPIVFRSGRAVTAAGQWHGIRVYGNGYVDLNYVVVEHASDALAFDGGEGLVRHSTLRTSSRGAWVGANSSPTFTEGYAIYGNNEGVLVVGNSVAAQNPQPVFTNGSIRDNTSQNYRTENFGNGGTVVLNATGNWWNSTDPTTIRSKIFDRVDSAALPKVDILEYRDAAGLSHLIAFDFVFTRRGVDAFAALTSHTDFVLNTAADAVFEIRREDTDAIVRSIAVPGLSAGPNSFEWDGNLDDGSFAAEGLYRVIPRLTKDVRNWSLDPQAPVPLGSGVGPIPARFNPYKNEFWKIFYNKPQGDIVRMRVTPSSGAPFEPIVQRFMAPTTEWLYWDGRNPQGELVPGTLEIYFYAPTYARPHYLRVLHSQPAITGIAAAPAIEVKADPYLVTHSYEQLSRMAFRVDVDAYVTVKLLPPGIVDPSSSQAIVVMPEQLLSAVDGQGAPVNHQVEWRGNEATDPNRMRTTAEGAYTFTIQARSPITNRTTLYRGVLQIYQ